MKKQITILMMVVASFGAYAQHDHNAHASHTQDNGGAAFKDEKLNTAYSHYLHLKDALVASNGDEAKKVAAELQKTLGSIANGTKASLEAEKIATSSDLKTQRTSFSALSNEMTTLAKANKLATGSIFIEYCPMANNNEGAFWLSNEKEIKNPYFGNMMLNCGSVKETIQ